MKLLLNDDLVSFRRLFTTPVSTGPEIASRYISPSGLHCQRAVAFKLTGTEMLPEERSFESDGYASSGSARHAIIQKFLIDNPEVEWVDVGKYVEENDLPFDWDYDWGVRKLAERLNISPDEVCEIIGSYERVLTHKNGLTKFKLDGIIKYRGLYYIVEIKTSSSKKCEKAPLEKHQLQGKAYSLFLKIPRICWIYESREDFKHSIAFQEILNSDIEFIRGYLNEIVKNKEKPWLLKGLPKNECKFCRFSKVCKEVMDAHGNDIVF